MTLCTNQKIGFAHMDTSGTFETIHLINQVESGYKLTAYKFDSINVHMPDMTIPDPHLPQNVMFYKLSILRWLDSTCNKPICIKPNRLKVHGINFDSDNISQAKTDVSQKPYERPCKSVKKILENIFVKEILQFPTNL